MSEMSIGIQYYSGKTYSMDGEGLEWTGIRVDRNSNDNIHLSFQGCLLWNHRGEERVVPRPSTAYINMTAPQAIAIAGALLSIAQGAGSSVTVNFTETDRPTYPTKASLQAPSKVY